MSSGGFSALEKKAQICSLLAAACNGCLAPSNLKKKARNGHFYMQRAVTPDQITQQN
jgi:hypothetical protein